MYGNWRSIRNVCNADHFLNYEKSSHLISCNDYDKIVMLVFQIQESMCVCMSTCVCTRCTLTVSNCSERNGDL